MTTEDGPDDDGEWYVDVAAALRKKQPEDVAREVPGLVDIVAEADPGVDHFVVGVSFSTRHTRLDYAVEAVRGDGEERTVETVKEPTAAGHRYVHFTHPPDPHFDAAALRARILSAVDRARREAASDDPPTPGFADLWEDL